MRCCKYVDSNTKWNVAIFRDAPKKQTISSKYSKATEISEYYTSLKGFTGVIHVSAFRVLTPYTFFACGCQRFEQKYSPRSTLKMEESSSSETLVSTYATTRRHNAQGQSQEYLRTMFKHTQDSLQHTLLRNIWGLCLNTRKIRYSTLCSGISEDYV
jgi:hypothetical protein